MRARPRCPFPRAETMPAEGLPYSCPSAATCVRRCARLEPMRPQDWAFLAALAAAVSTVAAAVQGRWLVAIGLATLTAALDRWSHALSRRHHGPMPAFFRWGLLWPRNLLDAAHLMRLLAPRPGERIFELGPGIGVHALPVAVGAVPVRDALRPRCAAVDAQSSGAAGGPGGCREHRVDARGRPDTPVSGVQLRRGVLDRRAGGASIRAGRAWRAAPDPEARWPAGRRRALPRSRFRQPARARGRRPGLRLRAGVPAERIRLIYLARFTVVAAGAPTEPAGGALRAGRRPTDR